MKFFSNREFRVKMVRTPENQFSEEDILEEPSVDPEQIKDAAKELVTHAAVTIFTLAVAYKAFDTICKIIVKKV